ncbi:hypothetical protein ACIBCB_29215 [Streptomyces uncialis]|uniref:hypothetical protein n=1 Tax=Streptomyces uncialis TaxID=1048205 RepID=UPI0037A4D8C2
MSRTARRAPEPGRPARRNHRGHRGHRAQGRTDKAGGRHGAMAWDIHEEPVPAAGTRGDTEPSGAADHARATVVGRVLAKLDEQGRYVLVRC